MMFSANESALCNVFELLASHPDVQMELEHVNVDLDLGYDQLMSLPPLDAV
jgi:hypothetical protein